MPYVKPSHSSAHRLRKLHEVIFEAGTPAGRAFDMILLACILASIYWAIVTMTTVGYGDIAPQTPIGQILAFAVMLLGYGIIAVPTGIVTVELSRISGKLVSTQARPSCGIEGHDPDAACCKYCGTQL